MIRYCIFDLSGTIADKYSLIPKLALRNTFRKDGIILPKNIKKIYYFINILI